jgi:bacillithiol biosynthesis deacetylase BshB1
MAMADVLAFGAHPDDVELGCAGTMLRLYDAGFETVVVDLTAGERGSNGTPELRAAEAEAASGLMGLAARENLGFPDTELEPSLALRRAIVEAIRRHRPRIVLAPLPGDLHPDHDVTGSAVAAAFYPSGMRNLAADGEPFRPDRLFHYFMHDERDTALVVDVTPVWERRMKVARCFSSQFHQGSTESEFPTLISRPDFFDRIEARARVFGRRAGVTFGEPLWMRDALPVADLALLFGGA